MSLIGLKCKEISSLFSTVVSVPVSGTDNTVLDNDNEISLHFKPMRLIFINYSV